MDNQHNHYNEQRDDKAFEHMTQRTPGVQSNDPYRVHDWGTSEPMTDSIDTVGWNSSQVPRDKTRDQMMSARRLRQGAN